MHTFKIPLILILLSVVFISCGKDKGIAPSSSNSSAGDSAVNNTVPVKTAEELYREAHGKALNSANELKESINEIYAMIVSIDVSTTLNQQGEATKDEADLYQQCLVDNELPSHLIKNCLVQIGSLYQSLLDLQQLVLKLRATNPLIPVDLVDAIADAISDFDQALIDYSKAIELGLK